MQNNIRKPFVQIASVLLLALGTVTAAHAISQPIQTQGGVVRLGSKTQAHVDAKESSVAIGEGMVLVSSNPGRLGRPALKVTFNGAPMRAKVQGTALIAFLSGNFIQITGVEGRTYLVREGRLGENVAIDAGKMLLVKPRAKRLPDTVDINISHFIENSPMFNGGLKLAASSLIAQAIRKQSENRHLKSTPIYFEGAGSEAVVASENPELASIGDGLGDEGTPLDTSLTGIEAIERIPTGLEGPQLVAQQSGSPQLVAQQSGSPQLVAQQSVRPQLIAQQSGSPQLVSAESGTFGPGPGVVEAGFGRVNDSPGAPNWGDVTANVAFDRFPSRGFLKEFTDDRNATLWFPMTEPDESIFRNQERDPDGKTHNIEGPKRRGLVQGVSIFDPPRENEIPRVASFIIFPEARIPDAMAKTPFKITPTLGGNSTVTLKFSNQDIPSDILNLEQFNNAFTHSGVAGEVNNDTSVINVILRDDGRRDDGLPLRVGIPVDSFAPLDKTKPENKPWLETTLVVPPEGITISGRFFKTDTITQPNGANDPFPVLGLAAPTFLGSVFVNVTSGDAVIVEVGDRTGTSPQGALTFGLSELGIFSLQALGSDATVAGGAPSGLTIESDAPLKIPLNIPLALITGNTVVSKQSIDVQSASSKFLFSEATLSAGQDIAVSSSGELVFSNAKLNSGQGIAVSSSGELVFNEATLDAGQRIVISSPKRIRFENSQATAVTALDMRAGSAALEMVNSTVTAPNGEILISGGELVFSKAKLAAGQGIAVSSFGELLFSEARLAAGQGIAASSSGEFVFSKAKLNAGQGIAASSSGELAFSKAKLNAGQGIAVSSFGELAFSKARLNAGQGIAASSFGELAFSKAKLNAGQDIAASSFGKLAFSKAKLNAGQGIAVSSFGELVFNEATLNAGQGILLSSPKRIRFENSSELTAATTVDMRAGTAALEMVNSAITAPNGEILISGGELVFSKAKLNAGTRIAVSSPKRIRFENSSELAAVTAVVMQGAGTAALEMVNSAITTPNGQILIDQFGRLQMENAILSASVIRARVVSPSGVLQISNSTLAAGELLRLYAEGSRGMVEFIGAVNLNGKKIDIAGNTVRVQKNGKVTTSPNTTVYANSRQYNKDGFGKISEHKQGNFKARPSF